MTRRQRVVPILTALLFAACAMVYAFLVLDAARWEFWVARLARSTLDITPGWSFGSSAMLAVSLIFLTSVINLRRGRHASRAPVVVGLAFLLFDAAAYFYAGRNLQVIGFIAIGLIGVFVTGFGKVPTRVSGA